MKDLLNYLCDTLDPIERRARLSSILTAWFPDRVLIQQTRKWDPTDTVQETINYLIPFGKQSDHLVIGAHYDAVPNCPGANDNGAGVVQLLLAAHQLAASGREPNVSFCFWDHEEHYGSKYMGSKLFTNQSLGRWPKKAIVYDVTGIGDVFYVSGKDETDLALDLPSRRTPPSDDLNLKAVGIPTTLICALPESEMAVGYPESWHTMHSMQDTPDKVWDASLTAGAELALRLVGRFS